MSLWIQNVPVCTGTTPACGNTCGRGASTHEDVPNVHTGGILNVHTGRGVGWGKGERGVSVTHQHQHQHTRQHPHMERGVGVWGREVSATHQHQHIAHQQQTQSTTHKRTTHNTQHRTRKVSSTKICPRKDVTLPQRLRNPWILHVFSLRIDREQHVPDSSNHSLHLIKLFNFSSPEGH